jgi:hypothetical protein
MTLPALKKGRETRPFLLLTVDQSVILDDCAAHNNHAGSVDASRDGVKKDIDERGLMLNGHIDRSIAALLLDCILDCVLQRSLGCIRGQVEQLGAARCSQEFIDPYFGCEVSQNSCLRSFET